MPSIVDKYTVPKSHDKRIKLTDDDKEFIRQLYKEGLYSQRELAREFGVSRRSIVFAIYPERRVQNYQTRVDKGGSKQYYDKDKNTASIQKHREYKKDLLDQNIIGEGGQSGKQ